VILIDEFLMCGEAADSDIPCNVLNYLCSELDKQFRHSDLISSLDLCFTSLLATFVDGKNSIQTGTGRIVKMISLAGVDQETASQLFTGIEAERKEFLIANCGGNFRYLECVLESLTYTRTLRDPTQYVLELVVDRLVDKYKKVYKNSDIIKAVLLRKPLKVDDKIGDYTVDELIGLGKILWSLLIFRVFNESSYWK
jgi:hypothetical protein